MLVETDFPFIPMIYEIEGGGGCLFKGGAHLKLCLEVGAYQSLGAYLRKCSISSHRTA